MRVAELVHGATIRLEAADIDDARLEAEVLLAHVLGIDRAHLLARRDDVVEHDAVARFDALLARRLAREPLAYIVGHREFYGIEIACGPGALIPRPETEMLVELALADVARRGADLRVADVGTGSGAIAVAVTMNAPGLRVTAVDASAGALRVAAENVRRAGVAGRVELIEGDLLAGRGVFDVIVANLPYVSAAEWDALAPEIRAHEPRSALVGGERGTEAIERLLRASASHLAPGGLLAAEIGATQAARLLGAASACFPDADVCVKKDMAGLDRVLVVRRTGGGVEDEEALRQAVDAQARARVEGSVAGFASYITPQALLRLHRQGEPLRAAGRSRDYQVLDITVTGDSGKSDVRYSGGGAYVLRTRWERRDGLWKAVMVEMPPELIQAPWWRRVLRLQRGGVDASVQERRDLR